MTKWKEIEGDWWEGTVYEVSDDGRVRQCKELTQSNLLSPKPRAYLRDASGTYRPRKVDQLVAEAFGVKVANMNRIVHKDGDINNNRKENLA